MSKHCLLFIILLLLVSPVFAQTDRQQELEKTKKQLTETRQEVNQLLDQQADALQRLNKIDQELELSSRLQRKFRYQQRIAKKQIDSLMQEMESLESQYITQNKTLTATMRKYYKYNRNRESLSFFNQHTALNSERVQYAFGIILENENNEMHQTLNRIDGYQEIVTELAERNKQLAILTSVQEKEAIKARKSIAEREQILAEIQGEKSKRLKELGELEQVSQLLGDIIKEIDQDAFKKADQEIVAREWQLLQQVKGKFYWPLKGSIISRFGLHENKRTGITTKNSGIKIASKKGEKVIATMTGEVIYIGWLRGLENFIVLNHGGELYSLYGNLENITVQEGDQLIRGEMLALAKAKRLHFEIREGKKAVDPLNWLKR